MWVGSTQNKNTQFKNLEQSQDIKQIVSDLQQKLNLNCSICSYRYNTQNKIPKIICRRQHTYCSQCVSLILRARPLRCPQCRFKIFVQNIFINRALLSFCQTLPSLQNAISLLMQKNKILEENNKKLINKQQQKQISKTQEKIKIQFKQYKTNQKSKDLNQKKYAFSNFKQKTKINEKKPQFNPEQSLMIINKSKINSSNIKQREESRRIQKAAQILNRQRYISIAHRRN